MAKVKKEGSIEESLAQLESIIKKLESSNIGLEDSLKEFEDGVKIYKDCKGLLSKAEKKIKVLTESLDEEDF